MNFTLLFLENHLIKEATLIEKAAAALELALIRERQNLISQLGTDRRECTTTDKVFGGDCRLKMKVDKKKAGSERRHFLTRCGTVWKFLKNVQEDEFDKLRREHQVSRNRSVGYGIRFACTRNAKLRDNCPYLLLCRKMANGSLNVYYRNAHTHPVRQIRAKEAGVPLHSSDSDRLSFRSRISTGSDLQSNQSLNGNPCQIGH